MSCVLSSFNSFMSSYFRFYLLALLFFTFVEALWDTKNIESKTEASNIKQKKTLHSTQRVTSPKSYGKMSKGRRKESKIKGPKRYSVQVLEKEKHGSVKVIPCQDRYI